jgi:hypothetical protein
LLTIPRAADAGDKNIQEVPQQTSGFHDSIGHRATELSISLRLGHLLKAVHMNEIDA